MGEERRANSSKMAPLDSLYPSRGRKTSPATGQTLRAGGGLIGVKPPWLVHGGEGALRKPPGENYVARRKLTSFPGTTMTRSTRLVPISSIIFGRVSALDSSFSLSSAEGWTIRSQSLPSK